MAANNLATGIGLSGRFDYSNEGAQAKLQAERDLYGERRAEQASKEKAKQKRLDEIKSDTAFSTFIKTPRFRREWQAKATEAFDNILQSAENGENKGVVSANEINQFRQYTQAMVAQDNQVQESLKKVATDPLAYGFNKGADINNKRYNNWEEAFNSADVSMDDFKKAYQGSEFSFVKDPLLGELFGHNPVRRVTEGEFLASIKTASQDERVYRDTKGPDGKKNWGQSRNKVGDEEAERLINSNMLNQMGQGYSRGIEDEIIPALQQKYPDKTEAELRNTPEYLQETDIKWGGVKRRLSSRGSDWKDLTDQYPPVKEAKKSDFDNTFNRTGEVTVENDYAGQKIVNRITYPVRSGKTFNKVKVTVPPGSKIYNAQGQLSNSTDRLISGTPIGSQWFKEKIWFVYQSEDEEGKQQETLVDLTQGSFQTFVQSSGIDPNLLISDIKEVAKGDALALRKVYEFIKNLTGKEYPFIVGADSESGAATKKTELTGKSR